MAAAFEPLIEEIKDFGSFLRRKGLVLVDGMRKLAIARQTLMPSLNSAVGAADG